MQPDMDVDGVEKQTVHRDTEIRRKNNSRKKACLSCCISLTFSCVMGACIVLALNYYRVNAEYSVATESVSGLDQKAGLSFNLTLGVASRSPGAEACINPGMFVEVFYRGIRVAASDGEARMVERTCARPLDVAELTVVATATAMPVGQGLESLAAEMRDGEAVFDFQLHLPARSYGGYSNQATSWVTHCKGSLVGGPAAVCDSPNQND